MDLSSLGGAGKAISVARRLRQNIRVCDNQRPRTMGRKLRFDVRKRKRSPVEGAIKNCQLILNFIVIKFLGEVFHNDNIDYIFTVDMYL